MKNLRDFIDLFNADGYDEKSKLILKISSIIREQGFAQMKIDDFTKYMDISKATFYKHFQSKDEVVECYVRLFIKDFIDRNGRTSKPINSYPSFGTISLSILCFVPTNKIDASFFLNSFAIANAGYI